MFAALNQALDQASLSQLLCASLFAVLLIVLFVHSLIIADKNKRVYDLIDENEDHKAHLYRLENEIRGKNREIRRLSLLNDQLEHDLINANLRNLHDKPFRVTG